MVTLPVGQLPQVVPPPAVAAATPAVGSGDSAVETAGVATDRGRDDPDYSEYKYFSDAKSSSGSIDFPWISPIPEDTGIISCHITDCFESNGARYITVNYVFLRCKCNY